MERNYTERNILDEVLKNRQKHEKCAMLIVIPGVLLFTAMIFLICVKTNSSMIGPVILLLFSVLLIAGLTASYLQVGEMVEKLKDRLGIDSDERLELMLEKSQQVDEFVFIDSERIIDFFRYDFTPVRRITRAETDMVNSDDGRPYVVKMEVIGEGNKFLCFKNKDARDKAYKIIAAAVEFRTKTL